MYFMFCDECLRVDQIPYPSCSLFRMFKQKKSFIGVPGIDSKDLLSLKTSNKI